MKQRDRNYASLGITGEEVKALKLKCQSAKGEEQLIILDCCIKANEDIAQDIFYSITKDISFDSLNKQCYIPIERSTFYGCQRKAICLIKDVLKEKGEWI